jgi:chemotaxis protein CheX
MSDSTAPKLSFEVIPSEGYTTLKLVGAFENDSAKALLEQTKTLTEPPVHMIVNCEHSGEITANGIRALVQFQQKLKSVNKQMRLLGVSDPLQKLFKQEGVDKSLKIVPSLRSALVEFGLVTARTLDVNFINPFLLATVNVLEIQASTKAIQGQIYKKTSKDQFNGDISGVIGLISDAFSGSVVITFPKDTFLKIMSRMLGEEVTVINKDIEDGAGELTNIIFGQAKVSLNEKGYGIKTAIPSVISGEGHSVLQMTDGPRVVIPFETDVGKFFVEICLSA